ncbi:ATP-dependent metallopeptidase Hfl [Auricularia subglabra TFB-10046 SS5]|nr:ATP-dependent metallopeptidase Hfl [Auricularia subglabra TFB-10046 SS5]
MLPGLAGQILRSSARISSSSNSFLPRHLTAQATLSPFAAPARSFHSSSRPLLPRRTIPPVQARHISLSSLWKPAPSTPSPFKIWRVSRLEDDADAAPQDADRQVAFFQGLAELDNKAMYERIIRRWERMCEFSPSNPTLRSDEAFRLYVLALVKTGQQDSVPSATRRRESILAKNPLPGQTEVQPLPEGQTRSDKIANSVLEDPKAHTKLNANPELAASPEASPVAATASVTGSGTSTSAPLNGVQALLTAGGAGGKDAPIYVTIAQPKGEAMWRFLRFMGLLLVGGFLVFSFVALVAENTGILKQKTEPSEYQVTQGKVVQFSDVHGVDEAKDELQEIVQFLKDPSAFAALGGRLSKGVLLTGPPGTGKTLLARAVAGEAGVPFFFASGSEFDEMFVGVGAKRMRNLFKAAREKQPAIIFIDELDAIGTKRSARDQQHMKQTLNQLLVEMDGFSPADGIIVIAATNFPQSLDNALVRPGRFDKKIAVPLPDIRGREQILKHHLRNTKLAPGVDVSILARGTSGFSGADIENLCNQAAVKAAKDGFQHVALKHLEWARDRIIMGAERRSFFMDDATKLMTAYHEGGHALVSLYTEGAMPLYKVTCMPRGHSLGHTSFLPEKDRISVSLQQYRASIDVSMGGRVAEEIVYGPEQVTSGCSSDLQNATAIAKAMVRHWGMSEKVGPVFYHANDHSMSGHEREIIENEVRRILTAASDRAKEILTTRREELRLLAEALVEYETLDMEEVKKVIKGHRIRQDEKHNVSNVEVTRITSTPLPRPPTDSEPVGVPASSSTPDAPSS